MIAEIRAYALENYLVDGWDWLLECWSDEDISEAVVLCDSVEMAIEGLRIICSSYNDIRKESML
jgi:hypothetical protein